MKRLILLLTLLSFGLFLLLSGCDNVQPEIRGTPTPSASPTPLPDPFTARITAEPAPTDALGNEILGENHYERYLSPGDLRVYEYDDGTFLDGVLVNAYPLPLDGELRIVYYTDAGKICGVGTLHNAEGGTLLASGVNAVYAEISTDIDVRMMDFELEVVTAFHPVENAEAAG